MSSLFSTKENITNAINALTVLGSSSGWKLIEQILDENIAANMEKLEKGFTGETKADVDLLRDRLSFSKWFRNLPQGIIQKLQSPVVGETEIDPFQTAEELVASRKRTLDK